MTGVVGKYSTLPIEKLLLDKENPRFQSGSKLETQVELANKLIMGYDVYQIAKNIAKNGYFAPSPMVVVESDNRGEEGKFTVVEGNRRLSALKAISDSNFRKQLYDPKSWEEIASQSNFDPDTEIPVVIVDRSEVELLLGYRHISGDLPWQPLAQARWVAKVIDQLGYTFEEAANTSGKSKSDIIAMYRNQAIAGQAEKLGFSAALLENNFSLITVAMTSPGLRDFISAPSNTAVQTNGDPIPEEKTENLRELLSWLYGDEENGLEPVVPESRQISKLGAIVQNPAGLDCLRKTWNIDEAEAIIKDTKVNPLQRLKMKLTTAKKSAQSAIEDIDAFSGDNEVLTLIDDIEAIVSELREITDAIG